MDKYDQTIVAENRTTRIKLICATFVLTVFVLSLFVVIYKSIDTPDPMDIETGTTLNCVVQDY